MDFDNRKVYGDTSITDGLVIKITVKTTILKQQPINFVYCFRWRKAAIEKQNLTEKKTLTTTKSATKFVHKSTL